MVECRRWKQNLNKQSAVHHAELPARLTRGSSSSDIPPRRGGGRGVTAWGDLGDTEHGVLNPSHLCGDGQGTQIRGDTAGRTPH